MQKIWNNINGCTFCKKKVTQRSIFQYSLKYFYWLLDFRDKLFYIHSLISKAIAIYSSEQPVTVSLYPTFAIKDPQSRLKKCEKVPLELKKIGFCKKYKGVFLQHQILTFIQFFTIFFSVLCIYNSLNRSQPSSWISTTKKNRYPNFHLKGNWLRSIKKTNRLTI